MTPFPRYARVTVRRRIRFALCLLLPVLGAAETLPFTLPWDDNSDNLTNLGHTVHAPAGQWGWVDVSPEGHFTLAGERLRFYGVNIGAAACFPPPEKAGAIARRMARFGFNVVRFHHLENGWTESLLDYGSGNSRTFDVGNLDRLDRFSAELKDAGLYLNLNLLASRVFTSGDGLPAEVDTMSWKEQHILAFFHEPSLALHKEHAANLLGHTNPYTGLTYAEDPAVAFVEVNNENGLMHQWFMGAFDRLPDVFTAELATRWNSWLQARYANTAELAAAWGVVDEAEGDNLLANASFASGTTGWNFEQHQGAAGTFTTGTFSGRQAARVTVNTTGSAGWHIQLNQSGLGVTADQIYTLRFKARASAPFSLGVNVSQAHEPWGAVGLNTAAALTTAWQSFSYTFFASETDPNVRIGFTGMGTFAGSVDLDDVELRPGGSAGGVGGGIDLESGNLPVLLPGETLLPAQRRDWLAFLRDLETAYWSEMKRYIVEDLGYPGIVWGTTVMNSTPNVQGLYDAIDTHSYWQHPHFPNADWSPTDWYVPNLPMVNDPDGGVIGGLARQAVAGFPHNVTEYQHSAPNTYSTDAGLFLALYGSLQDWDGLYLFHYGSGSDDWDRGHFNGFFDIDQHSPKLVNAALGSLLFRRFAIAPANETVIMRFDPVRELDLLAARGSGWNVVNLSHLDFPARLALVHGVRMAIGPSADGLDTPPAAPVGSVITSDTGELVWDRSEADAGVVTLDSPQGKAVIGFDAGRSFALDGLSFDPGSTEQGWSTFAAVLLEGRFDRLAEAGARGLLATTGYTENTGMQWTDSSRSSVGNQWGTAPLLTENVPGAVVLPGLDHTRVRVWSLDVRGDRTAELTVTSDGAGGTRFELGGATGSLWYEFEVASPAPPATPADLQVMARRADRLVVGWERELDTTGHRLEFALPGESWQVADGLAGEAADGASRFALPDLPEGSVINLRLTPYNLGGDGPTTSLSTSTRLSYASWASTRFSEPELSNAAVSGRHADPDGDRLANELEAALALDPFIAEPSPLPWPQLEAEAGDVLLTWNLPATGLDPSAPALELRVSENLRDWRTAPSALPDLPTEAFRVERLWSDQTGQAGNGATGDPLFWRWTTAD